MLKRTRRKHSPTKSPQPRLSAHSEQILPRHDERTVPQNDRYFTRHVLLPARTNRLLASLPTLLMKRVYV